MTVPTVSCTNCGKNFTTDDLRGTSCRFCGTVLAHHARAAQQVAVVNQMLADRNGNGIPDAYEGLVANAQNNAMNQAFGYPPAGGFGAPMHPYAQVNMNAVNAQMEQAVKTTGKVMLFTFVGIAVFTVLLAVGIAAFLFVVR